jgi:hypothetical protein
MEIRGYVSRMGWRLAILLLFPLVAGGVAYALLADTPQQHRAETVLTVPSSVAGGPSSSSVAQYMANFEQAIVSDQVIVGIASEVGVDAEDVRGGLQTTQLGSSNLVRVAYQGSVDAARIVELATRSAFELVSQIQLPFGQSLDSLRSRVRTTSEELRESEGRLEDFLLESGLVLPREQYLMIAAEVAGLERQIVEAEAAGSPAVALEAALTERRRELARIGDVLPTYERLQAAVDRAEEDLDAAQDEMRLAREQTVHLDPQMTVVTAHAIPRLQTIGKGVGIAAAAGLIAALALLFLFPTRSALPAGTQRNAFGFPART